jgi:hypothetical protein
MYLQRTAAAINSLQNTMQNKNTSLQNSPVSPLSPSHNNNDTHQMIVQSNKKSLNATTPSAVVLPKAQANAKRTSIHKRNSSLDSSRYLTSTIMSTSLQNNSSSNNSNCNYLDNNNKSQLQQHSRHNSYDGMHRATHTKYSHFDQTDDDDYESMPSRKNTKTTLPQQPNVLTKQKQQQHPQPSPIKRSSSFNVKAHEIQSPARITSGTPKMHNKFMKSAPSHNSRLQKSASSSCFKQMTKSLHDDDDDDYENEFYINNDDDLDPNNQFTPSDESGDEEKKYSLTIVNDNPPITNTRYNKTFLMRCEQNKNKVATGSGKPLGAIACPNTPEMPRRDMAARASMRDRASMPRDSSLNRILDKKPHSAGANSSTTSTPKNSSNAGRVTSKYLDISKYKPERGNNFLKRDETKSYLNREVKKSSSSACLQNFQRDVQARTSTRSSSGVGNSNSRPSSGSTNTKKKEGECEVMHQ